MQTVTFQLTDQAYERLDTTSFAESLTKTDVLNRAVQVYAMISAAQPGQVIDINGADGLWRTVMVIPREPQPWAIIYRPSWWRRWRGKVSGRAQ